MGPNRSKVSKCDQMGPNGSQKKSPQKINVQIKT